MRHAFAALVAFVSLTIAMARADDAMPPKGLSTSDWSSIRAAYEANRHAAFPVGTEFHARNFAQRWKLRFDGRGFLATPDAGVHTGESPCWSWGLELVSFGREGAMQDVSTPRCIDTQGGRVSYEWDDSLTEWYINDRRGLEHGFTVHQRPVAAPIPEGRRGTRTHAGQAWEHTENTRLTRDSSSPAEGGRYLQFTLAVRGDLRPDVGADDRGVVFLNTNDEIVLNYGKLDVFDANGVKLSAWIETPSTSRNENGVIHLKIDDSGAQYPLSIDPIAQQAYLKASNTNGGLSPDRFGYSVAMFGETVVIGALQEGSSATGVNGNEADNSAADAGAAYIFVRNGGTWAQQAYLKASNTGAGDKFGNSVAISGDTVVVGANGEGSSATGVDGNQADNSAPNSGAAYVFVRNGETWSQQAYLKASNSGPNDGFGQSLAISNDTVVVGAPYEASNATGLNGNQADNSASNSGAAYIFSRSGTVWSQQAYVKASNTGGGTPGDFFGSAVAVSGTTVVVGAYQEDSSATGVNGNQTNNNAANSGAAYVFVNSGDVWSQQAYLKASNTQGNDWFGMSVAVSADTVLVGAPNEGSMATGVNGNQADNSAAFAGAAYVFVRSGVVWSQQAYLKASNTGMGDNFGYSLAISGDTAVIGAIAEASNATGINGNQTNNSASIAGAAYVFVRNAGGIWSQQAYVKASNTGANDRFGNSVAISNDSVVIGAAGEASNATGIDGNQADNSAVDAGAAYIIQRNAGGSWSQQAYVKGTNTEGTASPDTFGTSVAVSGDTVVVGAYKESSNAIGVNGNQTSNEASESGAAYVFVHGPAGWVQQAYVKASNTQFMDHFGTAVAISGDTLVVGAPYEDSNSTGINGIQSDNSASSSGAVYVFTRNGGVWSQQAYVKAANTGAGDQFGISVALSTDTLIVGSFAEDSSSTGINGNQADNGANNAGAAYVFVRNNGVWSQQAYMKASNTGANDLFGYPVGISGDTAVVGAYLEDSAAIGINGNQMDNSASDAGAAYVFVRSSGVWSQQAYLKASNTGALDWFGVSVAISDDTVVVGAIQEDSSATGINGNQADNGTSNSGAAYVFVRTAGVWSQQAYLKASNTGAEDMFGFPVAIAGNTLIVGAYHEDSSATGVNGNQADNNSMDSGAAYLFDRDVDGNWSQEAYLKASNTGTGDTFGVAAAVSGNVIVVGAELEDSNATGINGNGADNTASDSGAAYIFVICPNLITDVPAFVLALVDPVAYETSYLGCLPGNDMNADGLVNGADIQGFVDFLVP